MKVEYRVAPDCLCQPDSSAAGDWADHEQWCPYSIWMLRHLHELGRLP